MFCNQVLEAENSGYRFVGDVITPISSATELKEIEEALGVPDKLRPVAEHIDAALRLYADRENPDYRNSIKESISAVEALCRLVTEKPKATLGEALKALSSKVRIHGAFKAAFEKLYGYTSDEEGIRHSLMTESDVQSEDAKFMLVSCSAFVNYVIEKCSRAGISF